MALHSEDGLALIAGPTGTDSEYSDFGNDSDSNSDGPDPKRVPF